MVCMLTHSQRLAIRFGGIGVMVLTAGAGIMAGAGIVLIMLGDILRVIGEVVTGAAGMAAVAIGDIITTGIMVLAGAGEVVEVVGHAILLIQVVALMHLIEAIPIHHVVRTITDRKAAEFQPQLLVAQVQQDEW